MKENQFEALNDGKATGATSLRQTPDYKSTGSQRNFGWHSQHPDSEVDAISTDSLRKVMVGTANQCGYLGSEEGLAFIDQLRKGAEAHAKLEAQTAHWLDFDAHYQAHDAEVQKAAADETLHSVVHRTRMQIQEQCRGKVAALHAMKKELFAKYHPFGEKLMQELATTANTLADDFQAKDAALHNEWGLKTSAPLLSRVLRRAAWTFTSSVSPLQSPGSYLDHLAQWDRKPVASTDVQDVGIVKRFMSAFRSTASASAS